MNVHQRLPVAAEVDVDAVVAALSEAPSSRPFDPALVDLCDTVSAGLMRHPASRRHPELVALAFWLRRSETSRLAVRFSALETEDTILVPRGLVFHLPPGNVDTISVYSWALSLLVGNRNVVRLSSRPSEVTDAIVAVLAECLAKAPPPVRATQVMVCYGHEDALTAALSSRVDVRVVWGGDATVRAIRAVPLPPHAVELTFPDRWSFAVLSAHAWRALDEAGKQDAAERFFNDAYWFDQLGCSSPRLVVWLGDGQACGRELFSRVARVAAERGWVADTGTALDKIHFAHRAVVDGLATGVFSPDNAVTVLQVASLDGLDRAHPGGGLFYQVDVDRLEDLAPRVRRADQTVTWLGLDPSELRSFARLLNGRGVDRFVPMGRALAFHRYWDGWDLLQGLTRRVYLESAP